MATIRGGDDRIRGLELMRAVLAAERDTLVGCGCGDRPIGGHGPAEAPLLHRLGA